MKSLIHKNAHFLLLGLLLLSLNLHPAQAQDQSSKFKYQGFSGGMMVHAGYLQNDLIPIPGKEISAMTTGIGGALRLHFGDHFRIGTEGYSSNAKLWDNTSYVHCGWGGLLVDFPFTFNRWTLVGGLTVGGGGSKGVYMLEGDSADWKPEPELYYHKSAYFMMDPYAAVEYRLTDVIHLIFKVDYMFGMGKHAKELPIGPRAYIGFMFYR